MLREWPKILRNPVGILVKAFLSQPGSTGTAQKRLQDEKRYEMHAFWQRPVILHCLAFNIFTIHA